MARVVASGTKQLRSLKPFVTASAECNFSKHNHPACFPSHLLCVLSIECGFCTKFQEYILWLLQGNSVAATQGANRWIEWRLCAQNAGQRQLGVPVQLRQVLRLNNQGFRAPLSIGTSPQYCLESFPIFCGASSSTPTFPESPHPLFHCRIFTYAGKSTRPSWTTVRDPLQHADTEASGYFPADAVGRVMPHRVRGV